MALAHLAYQDQTPQGAASQQGLYFICVWDTMTTAFSWDGAVSSGGGRAILCLGKLGRRFFEYGWNPWFVEVEQCIKYTYVTRSIRICTPFCNIHSSTHNPSEVQKALDQREYCVIFRDMICWFCIKTYFYSLTEPSWGVTAYGFNVKYEILSKFIIQYSLIVRGLPFV